MTVQIPTSVNVCLYKTKLLKSDNPSSSYNRRCRRYTQCIHGTLCSYGWLTTTTTTTTNTTTTTTVLQVRVSTRAGLCLGVLSRRQDFTVIATIPHSVNMSRDCEELCHDLIFAKCLQPNDRPVYYYYYYYYYYYTVAVVTVVLSAS